jgi:hypothetical protein
MPSYEMLGIFAAATLPFSFKFLTGKYLLIQHLLSKSILL